MKLLVLILSKTECMPGIVSRIVGEDLGDPTVINSEGALNVIDRSDVEPPPMFGGLRYILRQGKRESKMMFLITADESVKKAVEIIDSAVGGIDRPDTGIIFTVPVDGVYGLRKE